MRENVGMETKPRRWCQFRLRSMLTLTAAVAVWLSVQVSAARKERAIGATLRAVGADIYYEHQTPCITPDRNGFGAQLNPLPYPRLSAMIGEEYFQEVSLVCLPISGATDHVLQQLRDLPSLKVVFVGGGETNQVLVARAKVRSALPGIDVVPE